MSDSDAGKSNEWPIEPIPGISPPENRTGLSWQVLRKASDAAKRQGLPAPFICTNCMTKGNPEPVFYIEDAYVIAYASEFVPGEEGLIGVCRSCAPEMNHAGVAEIRGQKLRQSSGFLVIVLAVLAGFAVGAFWF